MIVDPRSFSYTRSGPAVTKHGIAQIQFRLSADVLEGPSETAVKESLRVAALGGGSSQYGASAA